MKIESLDKLLLVLLSEIYFVENKLVEAMPVMAQKAEASELKEALREHLKETKEQVKRLHKCFELLGKDPMRVDWINGMHTIFDKAASVFAENEKGPAMDAAIIAIAQRIEHFEIATYGTLKEFADTLDLDEVKHLLSETLKEEGHANEKLNKIAKGGLFKSGINAMASR